MGDCEGLQEVRLGSCWQFGWWGTWKVGSFVREGVGVRVFPVWWRCGGFTRDRDRWKLWIGSRQKFWCWCWFKHFYCQRQGRLTLAWKTSCTLLWGSIGGFFICKANELHCHWQRVRILWPNMHSCCLLCNSFHSFLLFSPLQHTQRKPFRMFWSKTELQTRETCRCHSSTMVEWLFGGSIFCVVCMEIPRYGVGS